MCATSGGGFALMTEALGAAAMMEVPLVCIDVQRAGPATGVPTKTEQGDLWQALGAGQGDYPRIIVAPTTIPDCFKIVPELFNLVDRFQCPGIILSDLLISEGRSSIDPAELDFNVPIDRGEVIGLNGHTPDLNGSAYKRYEFTDERRLAASRARARRASSTWWPPTSTTKKAGSSATSSPTRTSVRPCTKSACARWTACAAPSRRRRCSAPPTPKSRCWAGARPRASSAKPSSCWPTRRTSSPTTCRSSGSCRSTPTRSWRRFHSASEVIIVENNYSGQFARYLRSETSFVPFGHIRKYDGEPFMPHHIVEGVKQVLGGATTQYVPVHEMLV